MRTNNIMFLNGGFLFEADIGEHFHIVSLRSSSFWLQKYSDLLESFILQLQMEKLS